MRTLLINFLRRWPSSRSSMKPPRSPKGIRSVRWNTLSWHSRFLRMRTLLMNVLRRWPSFRSWTKPSSTNRTIQRTIFSRDIFASNERVLFWLMHYADSQGVDRERNPLLWQGIRSIDKLCSRDILSSDECVLCWSTSSQDGQAFDHQRTKPPPPLFFFEQAFDLFDEIHLCSVTPWRTSKIRRWTSCDPVRVFRWHLRCHSYSTGYQVISKLWYNSRPVQWMVSMNTLSWHFRFIRMRILLMNVLRRWPSFWSWTRPPFFDKLFDLFDKIRSRDITTP